MNKFINLVCICLFFSLTPEAMAMNNNGQTSKQGSSNRKSKRHTQPLLKNYGVQACERCYISKIRCNDKKPCDRCIKAGVECKPRTSFGLHRPGAKPTSTIQITDASTLEPNLPAETSLENCIQNSHDSDTSMVDESDISTLEIAPSDISQVDNNSEPSHDDGSSFVEEIYQMEIPSYTYISGEFIFAHSIPYYDQSIEDIKFLPGFDGTEQ